MKSDIHPNLAQVTIKCACGHSLQTYSTICKDFNVEICSACHPLYTGKQRIMDTAGRIDRFNKKYAKKASA
jgi:large subunit ribosomal protein L31